MAEVKDVILVNGENYYLESYVEKLLKNARAVSNLPLDETVNKGP